MPRIAQIQSSGSIWREKRCGYSRSTLMLTTCLPKNKPGPRKRPLHTITKRSTRAKKPWVRATSRSMRDTSGDLETRPYMRARAGLGEALRVTGKKVAAIPNFMEMLELNPGDNQGVRYILAAKLLDIGRMNELKVLLERCADEFSPDIDIHALSSAILRTRKKPTSLQNLLGKPISTFLACCLGAHRQ